jgi:hypothetical protein
MVTAGPPVRDMPLVIRCAGCDKLVTLDVNEQDFQDWKGGKLVQAAFPYLNDGEWDLLISNMCNDCREEMFSDGQGGEKEAIPTI